MVCFSMVVFVEVVLLFSYPLWCRLYYYVGCQGRRWPWLKIPDVWCTIITGNEVLVSGFYVITCRLKLGSWSN